MSQPQAIVLALARELEQRVGSTVLVVGPQQAPAFKCLRDVQLERKRNEAQSQPPMQQRKN